MPSQASSVDSGVDIRKNSFMQGAMILGVSMIVVKLLGMVFKLLFANVVDGVGYGMFNNAYGIYEPLFMLATAGFPIAISRTVSEAITQNRLKDVRRLHKITVPFLFITGIVCFFGMIFGGIFYTQNMIHSSESYYAIVCLAPTILFGCLMSIYRGYFEGTRNMLPTAISEIIEVSFKVVVGLTLAYAVSSYITSEYATDGTIFGQLMAGEEYAKQQIRGFTVAAGMIGISLGSLFGFLFLLFRYKIKGDGLSEERVRLSPPAQPSRTLFKKLALTAIPIGVGSIVLSLSSFIDNNLIQSRILSLMNTAPDALKQVYPYLDEALFRLDPVKGEFSIQTFFNGCYGYSLTVMMLIPTLTQAFGTSALPSITAAWTTRNKLLIKRSIETVLRTTMFVTLPAGLGLSVLAPHVLSLLYSNPNLADEVTVATGVLRVMGISVIFIATSTPICSMLQAVGRVDLPLKLMTLGLGIKIILNYILVGIPAINIQGATVGSLVGYLFISVTGVYFLCKETKIVPNFVPILIKPLIGAVFCAVAAYTGQGLFALALPNKLATVLAIVFAVVIYVIVLVLIKGITLADIEMLPKGNKIAKRLEKYHIIR